MRAAHPPQTGTTPAGASAAHAGALKKIGRLHDGGGWRVHCRDSLERRRARTGTRVGYEYVHAAIDDRTRLAYAEIHHPGVPRVVRTAGQRPDLTDLMAALAQADTARLHEPRRRYGRVPLWMGSALRLQVAA